MNSNTPELLTEKEISQVLIDSLNNETKLDIAVAFWGINNPIIDTFKSKKTRIICNLQTGGTNPKVIEDLLKHVQVRQNNKLHAKVYLGKSFVIVGSSNVSTNGMNHEDLEIESWHEANIFSREQKLLHNSKKWFEMLWNDAETTEITLEDIKKAKIKWNNRRASRPIIQTTEIFTNPAFVKDLNYRLTWDSYESCSNVAKTLYNKVKDERNYSLDYGFFETPSQWKPKRGSIIFDFGLDKTTDMLIYRDCVKIVEGNHIIKINKKFNIVIYQELNKFSKLSKNQIKQIQDKMNELYQQDMLPHDIDLYKFISKYMKSDQHKLKK